jgi:hypothetical protein
MVKRILWEASVVFTVLGGVTSCLAQEKPLPPQNAEDRPAAQQAQNDTPKEKVAKRRWAELEATLKAFIKKHESAERKNEVSVKGPGRAEALSSETRTSQTCLICRLKRVETTAAQKTTTTYEENECSRWYAANVEPHHDHVWENSTCVFVRLADGGTLNACSPGHYPIWLLSPKTQLAVYQHFKNPTDARELFLGLADAKTYGDHLEEDSNKGELIVDALEEWEAAGFPGTWKGWWETWYAQHIEEHKEYLTWLHSDSGLNFSDWQRQRHAGRGVTGPAPKSKK